VPRDPLTPLDGHKNKLGMVGHMGLTQIFKIASEGLEKYL